MLLHLSILGQILNGANFRYDEKIIVWIFDFIKIGKIGTLLLLSAID